VILFTLLRVLWDALFPPRPVCPQCSRHILIARELSAQLVECQVATRPVPRLWVVTDQASAPPDAPPLTAPLAWTSLYEASDGEGIGVL
jgi:hypothetical protein